MVRVKVWYTHTTVWLLKNYSERISTYYTRMLLLDLTYGLTMLDRFPPKDMCWGSRALFRFFYITDNMSETVADRDIITMEDSQEIT